MAMSRRSLSAYDKFLLAQQTEQNGNDAAAAEPAKPMATQPLRSPPSFSSPSSTSFLRKPLSLPLEEEKSLPHPSAGPSSLTSPSSSSLPSASTPRAASSPRRPLLVSPPEAQSGSLSLFSPKEEVKDPASPAVDEDLSAATAGLASTDAGEGRGADAEEGSSEAADAEEDPQLDEDEDSAEVEKADEEADGGEVSGDHSATSMVDQHEELNGDAAEEEELGGSYSYTDEEGLLDEDAELPLESLSPLPQTSAGSPSRSPSSHLDPEDDERISLTLTDGTDDPASPPLHSPLPLYLRLRSFPRLSH